MATFLNNLPSFNKENFSNFQPDLNQCPSKKSFIVCSRDYENPLEEQIIVNQRCNLIIQYLEKQAKEQQFISILSMNDKAKKRDIADVMKTSSDKSLPSSSLANNNRESQGFATEIRSSKCLKRRCLIQNSVETETDSNLETPNLRNNHHHHQDITMNTAPSTSGSANAARYEEFIDIDDNESQSNNDNIDF